MVLPHQVPHTPPPPLHTPPPLLHTPPPCYAVPPSWPMPLALLPVAAVGEAALAAPAVALPLLLLRSLCLFGEGAVGLAVCVRCASLAAYGRGWCWCGQGCCCRDQGCWCGQLPLPLRLRRILTDGQTKDWYHLRVLVSSSSTDTCSSTARQDGKCKRQKMSNSSTSNASKVPNKH